VPHSLDQTDGQTSFVSAREDAWHRLGTVLPDAFTAEEAMEHGLLGGWNVRKLPAWTTDDVTGKPLAMPGRFSVVRSNPVSRATEFLGDVGSVYHPIQNEEHCDFLNTLVDESGAHFETAGAINGGRQVFVTMKLPGYMQVGGVDRVNNYLAAVNSHDGSMPFTFMITPVRVVCENTLNLAFGRASRTFRVRHTRGARALIQQQAREALELTFKYLDEFQVMAEQLINTTLTQQAFEEIIMREFGPAKDAPAATVTRSTNKVDEMARLFADANTQEGIRNTAWAGLNALTEWSDHFSPTRGEDREAARAVNALLYPEFKDQALRLLLAVS
jgi:phage/plasmid-like protein (TIGR03299 family)